MRHIGVSRRSSLVDNRKVPLNTIVLPPISPPLPSESGAQFLGKVSVNKSKSGAVNGEIVLPSNGNRTSDVPRESPKPTDNPRVAQLEQNIRFLQEQHQLMLAGLHGEIDGLKTRNRELQFQLVFVKGSIPSSPSSPEDEAKPKAYPSPKATNSTPLQVEILEKELGELKLQLQEVESRNVYLSAIVDEQKKKLERYERDREKEREQRVANQSDENSELMRKLEDAEAIIRRLRRENSDLRRENCPPQGHYQQQRENSGHQQRRESNGYPSSRGGNGHHQGRGNRGHKGNGQYNRGNNWFPPLHSQSFWQGGRPADHDPASVSEAGPALSLDCPDMAASGTAHGQFSHPRRSNNNHYHHGEGGGGGGRRHRGGPRAGKQPPP